MTDRELLELAAKAAGITIIEWYGDESEIYWADHEPRQHEAVGWNPLIDDGDALRLLVKLRMGVSVFSSFVSVGDDFGSETHQEIGDDPYAATRRAIVRAAAEIGKEMQ